MPQKVIRTGNSLAVTIPADFAKSVGVRAGDTVRVNTEEDKGIVTYAFSGAKQLPLADNFLRTKKK